MSSSVVGPAEPLTETPDDTTPELTNCTVIAHSSLYPPETRTVSIPRT
jgi:hypothetical protein